jgi:polyisoprenoid-binding protein YceI
MQKFILGFILVFSMSVQVMAQRFLTKDASIHFNATSKNSPEAIEATTNKATLVIDATTGAIEMGLLVKSFHFEKNLMEEHFNENYIESTKFAKASFVGTIPTADLKKNGTHTVEVKGKLTLHGVTKEVTTKAEIVVTSGAISKAKANVKIKLSDYGITVPAIVKDKVASEAKLEISANLKAK